MIAGTVIASLSLLFHATITHTGQRRRTQRGRGQLRFDQRTSKRRLLKCFKWIRLENIKGSSEYVCVCVRKKAKVNCAKRQAKRRSRAGGGGEGGAQKSAQKQRKRKKKLDPNSRSACHLMRVNPHAVLDLSSGAELSPSLPRFLPLLLLLLFCLWGPPKRHSATSPGT